MPRKWTQEQRNAQRERAKAQLKNSNGRFVSRNYESGKYIGFKNDEFIAVDNAGKAYKEQKRVMRKREKKQAEKIELSEAILHDIHTGEKTTTKVVNDKGFIEQIREAAQKHKKKKEENKPIAVPYTDENGIYHPLRPIGEELEIAAYSLKMEAYKNETRVQQKVEIVENAMRDLNVEKFSKYYWKLLSEIDFKNVSLNFVMEVIEKANEKISELQEVSEGMIGYKFSYSTKVPKDALERRYNAAVDVLNENYIKLLFRTYKNDILQTTKDVLGDYAPELVAVLELLLNNVSEASIYFALKSNDRLDTAYVLQSIWDTENALRAKEETEKALNDIFMENADKLPPDVLEAIKSYLEMSE